MKLRAAALTLMMLSLLAACKPRETEQPAEATPAPSAETAATPAEAPAAPAPGTEAPAAPAETSMAQAGPAKYHVEFIPLWTRGVFPFEYPDTSPTQKPHFSGLIGTAHNANYHIFAEGQTPTPGLERLSEEGKHTPLDSEIKAAIAAGNALALSESDPLKDFSQTAVTEVAVDDAHPMVSLVAMIAPSPDWFAGVSDVNLKENGAWVPSKIVNVMAWDSGGDDGTTYLADDKDTNPKKPTTMNKSQHFLKNGSPMPVGRLTFTRM